MSLETSDSVSMRRIDPHDLENRLSEFGARVIAESRGAEPSSCVVQLDSQHSVAALARLRDDDSISLRRLVDLTAVDRMGSIDAPGKRFIVVYQLHSPTTKQRLRVEVAVAEEEPVVDSVSKLWPAALWLECEVFDLFGVRFRGHPDLRRILLDAEFEGAPLRKDHPRQLDRELPGEGAS